MDDEVWRRPLALSDPERHRLVAQFEADEKRRRDNEKREYERLQNDLKFSVMLSARGLDDEHLRHLALSAAAKELAAYPLHRDRLSIVAENAVKAACDQEASEFKQAVERDRKRQDLPGQQRPMPLSQQDHSASLGQHRQPDYFARNEPGIDRNRPERQPLGKYQALDDTTRRLREESDRQQPPVERHLQIDREVKNPDYRNTAREVSRRDTSGGIRQARGAAEQQERGTERNEGRNDPGRGGRSR